MAEPIDVIAHAQSLNEKRLRAWEEGKRLLDDVAREGREMSAEEHQTWTRINEDIDRLDRERDVYLTAEQREREAGELREANMREFGEQAVVSAEVQARTNFASWLRNGGRNERGETTPYSFNVTAAEAEQRYMRQGYSGEEARALAWDTGSVASAVPVTTDRSLYQYLEASIAMFRAPTRKFPTGSGEQMKLPRNAAHAIATQVSGQGTALAGTDPTFNSFVLDAYKYGELVIVANEVIQDSVVDIVDFVTGDIARALGRVIDTDLVVGTGTGQPNGIMTAVGGAGTIATGGSLIDPTYEKLVDLVYSVNDEYRNDPSCAWLMKDATAGVLRKLRDGAGGTVGAVLWDPSLTHGIQGGQPDRLLGYPVYTDPNVAALASNSKSILFGALNAYWVRTVGNITVERDDSRYFDTDQVAFRAKWRVDGELADATAVNLIKRSV